jgi:hypothetical protein
MTTLDYGKPIRIFADNMRTIGLKLRVDNGKLIVEDTKDILTPVLEHEIRKRAKHLIELLTKEQSAGQ